MTLSNRLARRGTELPASPEAQPREEENIVLASRRVYSCCHCRTHATDHAQLVSKAFHGRHGRAFLFNSVVNVDVGKSEDRLLLTGLHTVRDVLCRSCSATLGWQYVHAFEESQQYKIGKYILEKTRIHKEGDW